MSMLYTTTYLIVAAEAECGLGFNALFRLVLDLGGKCGGRGGVIDRFTGYVFGIGSRRVPVPCRRLLRLGPLELDGRFRHHCERR